MLPYPRANLHITQGLCLKNQNLYLDRVSTGSGSDLVSDQHATFVMIRDAYGWTRSLPLPVLTRSNRRLRLFEAKPPRGGTDPVQEHFVTSAERRLTSITVLFSR